MKITVLGPRDSLLRDSLREFKEKNQAVYAARRLEKSLWIEVNDEISSEIKSDLMRLNCRAFRDVRLLVMSPDHLSESPLLVYETLSILFSLSARYGLRLYYLLSGSEGSRLLRQVQLFILDEYLGDEGVQKTGTVFHFSGEMILWDTEEFRKQSAAETARAFFRLQREKERQGFALPDALHIWINEPGDAFRRLRDDWKRNMRSGIQGRNRLIGRWDLIRNFGTGRRNRLNTLRNALDPNATPELFNTVSSEIGSDRRRARFELLFPGVDVSSGSFAEEIRNLRQLLKSCYFPEVHSFDELAELRFEENTPTGSPFETEFWNERDSFNRQVRNILERIDVQNGTAPEGRRAIRRFRRELRGELRDLAGRLSDRVDGEVRDFLAMDNVFELSPQRFERAYRLFFMDVLRIIQLNVGLWRLRTFLRIPLDSIFPSLLYPWRSNQRYAAALLRQSIRILSFYRMMFQSVISYRENVADFMNEYSMLPKKVVDYKRHSENILRELEQASDMGRSVTFEFKNIDLSIVAAYSRPLPTVKDHLVPAVLQRFKRVDDLVQDSRTSRCRHLVNDPLGVFVPCRFHDMEAWKAAEQMVNRFLEDPDFAGRFMQDMMDEDVFDGNPRRYLLKTDSCETDCTWNGVLLKWKEKALRSVSVPIEKDALRPVCETDPERMEWFFNLSRKNEFWIENDDGNLGLKEELFPWTPERVRPHFFQKRTGITKERIQDVTLQQETELTRWFCWFVETGSVMGLSGPEDRKTMDFPPVPGAIFDLITEYSDPPVHAYYGWPQKIEGTHFMLVDTYSPSLMRLFAPETGDEAEPRCFTETQIREFLMDSENLADMAGLFFDYAVVTGKKEVIDAFVEKGLLSLEGQGLAFR